ncbi:hypothetical protein HD600_001881 [Microbacterium ginsengiterrae]|uniref:VWFA domain-containing protein n=1 Tax=Microbacterium ginsengiterrae TaxID=546115 RepID=A0A7W9FDJ8_9MICO|nr:hypothetical protein [Microbacterium ginsengiterrae]
MRSSRVAIVGLLATALIVSGATLASAEDGASAGDTASTPQAITTTSVSFPDAASSAPVEAPAADDSSPQAAPAPALPSAPEQRVMSGEAPATPEPPAETPTEPGEPGEPVDPTDPTVPAADEPAPPRAAAREVAPTAEIAARADSSHADIVIRKRVTAEPTQVTAAPSVNIGTDHSDTVGTVFRLFANTGSNTVGAATAYTCTITTGGECTITVDAVNSGGANSGKRFWVVEQAPVPGSPAALNTYINSELYVGDYTGPQDVRSLVGLTKALGANQTTYMPMTTGVSSGSGYTNIASADLPNTSATVGEAGSFGAVVGSRKNPVIAAKCEATPLRIGIVIDQSASITASQWTTFRNALVDGPNSVLRQLRDANAAVSILGFGSSVVSPNGWHYGSTGPTALPANNTTLQNLIPSSRPGGSSNATNWDAALSTIQSANPSHRYDMVLFVTDGAPNYILNGSQPSSTEVALRSLEAPMYAANAIKAAGTRLVTVGVGAGASGTKVAKNLRAVSGETFGSDYLQGDWDALKQILSDIVTAATCQVPVEVSKTQVNADGSTTTTAANWQFAAALQPGTTSGVTLSGTAGQTTTAGVAGKARWTIRFTQPGGQTAVLKLSETQKSGWALQSVACTLDAVPITTTVGGDGASIVVNGLHPSAGALSCVFTNKQSTPASVTVNKVWKIDGETFAHGDQPGGMDAALALTPAGQTGTPKWGQTRTGFLVGDSVTIAETTSIDPTLLPGCILTGSTIAGPGITGGAALPADGHAVTLASASSTYTVTNSVQCQRLTIVKDVDNRFGGDGTSDDWNGGLFAQRDDQPQLAFDSGETQYVAAGSYALSEAERDGYGQRGLSCTGGTLTGSRVEVAAGAHVTCTFVNEDLPGQVSWTKTDGTTKLAGSEWTLTGPGGRTTVVDDCVGANVAACAGMADQDPAAGAFLLKDLDWGDYSLVETAAPLGYVLDSTPHPFSVGATSAGSVIALGAFINTLGVAPALPLTGGLGSDFYTFFGLGVLVLALLLLAIRRLWVRRQVAEVGTR